MTPFTVATLKTPGGSKAAISINGFYYPIENIQPLLQPASSRTLLETWDTSLPLLEELSDSLATNGATNTAGIPQEAAHLLAPVLYPDNLLAVGGNYAGHLKAMGLEVKKSDVMPFFIRPPKSTLVGPGETVRIPKTTHQFDWECELAVFVGKRLKDAGRDEARAAIAGYAIGLDLTCRDLIWVDNDLKLDLVRGKGQDTMAPCGPAITPAKFVKDPNNLRIQLYVNDEKMMDASTSEMIYKIDEQLSVISRFITLQPGDILFTGSPAGSAKEHGGRWLKPGDRIHAEISEVGALDVTMRPDGDHSAAERSPVEFSAASGDIAGRPPFKIAITEEGLCVD
jgi:2-keto-4-pentenoate hydratase/2-oxohepta-3-ene-1,7-dioic acid hydratase in catechol pathway